MNKFMVIVLLVVLVLGGGYFLMKKGGTVSTPEPAPTDLKAPEQTSPAAASNQTPASTPIQVIVEGNEFAFTPSSFTLKQGQAVELTFKNTGKYPHDLSIEGINVSTKVIPSGQQDVITFTPDKTGEFNFTCTVTGHADKGMKGTITVTQ
jgi:plastocyanin